jgi:hypothetical protein
MRCDVCRGLLVRALPALWALSAACAVDDRGAFPVAPATPAAPSPALDAEKAGTPDAAEAPIDATAAPVGPISERPLIDAAVDRASAVDTAPSPPPDAAGATPDAAAPPPPNEIAGGIRGAPFPVARAFWLGRASSSPTRVVLLEAPARCGDIAAGGWDRRMGGMQILELGVEGTTPGVYQIRRTADASYVGPRGNPEADSGTVTIRALTTSMNVVGSFQLTFGGDRLTGTFDAAFCPPGVEP